MAYDEHLAERIQKVLDDKKVRYSGKKMFGGIAFMVDDKMCVGIIQNNLMARIGPEKYEAALEKDGCIEMDFAKRPMKGYVYVEPHAIDLDTDIEYWVQLCLDYNPLAKSSKKKKKP